MRHHHRWLGGPAPSRLVHTCASRLTTSFFSVYCINNTSNAPSNAPSLTQYNTFALFWLKESPAPRGRGHYYEHHKNMSSSTIAPPPGRASGPHPRCPALPTPQRGQRRPVLTADWASGAESHGAPTHPAGGTGPGQAGPVTGEPGEAGAGNQPGPPQGPIRLRKGANPDPGTDRTPSRLPNEPGAAHRCLRRSPPPVHSNATFPFSSNNDFHFT